MQISILELLKDEKLVRLKVNTGFIDYLLKVVTEDHLVNFLKLHPFSIKYKLYKSRSFTLQELIQLGLEFKISFAEIVKNVTHIKSGYRSRWINFKEIIHLDEDLTEGVSYYIGDGRSRTSRGLSTVNSEPEILKFFVMWLNKYFKADYNDLKIKLKISTLDFNRTELINKWTKYFNINVENVQLVKKQDGKPHHKLLIEVCYHRSISKLILDKLLPLVKVRCFSNKSLASAYIRGIMTAEGSARYNRKNHSKSIHLKMKDKSEIDYVHELLSEMFDIRTKVLYSKSDKEWLISISSRQDLIKMQSIGLFRLNPSRKNKLDEAISEWKHDQVKKGTVPEFYMHEISKLEAELGRGVTARDLSKFIGRHKSQTIRVMRALQKEGYLVGERVRQTGTPFRFFTIKNSFN